MLFASVIVIVIVGSFLFLRPGARESAVDPDSGVREEPTQVPTTAQPSEPPSATATTTDAADLFGGHTGGLGVPPGLQGAGSYTHLPKHQLTITMSTKGQLGTVAWIIPTSVENDRGAAKVLESTWSLSTTVYGNPDYAVVFGQQGRVDQPVTCTITVDGKVTERRSTQGAFSAMWCEG
ncbi:hypothetical protein [Nocardioides nitrophenolicus]|uniref:hypothetical protein n=1 Tax=Nocardioides nitrophenolicus TaxID=60489 RepID=UPI001957EA8F|nr:hypothetical protein [Nocardioides nitrophenolicus]MBM7516323.1 hypothetical protein [Nocardioides nitrophenolicus]